MATPLQNGWSALGSSRNDEAERQFRQAIQHGAEPDGYLGLAAVQLVRGNLQDALSYAETSRDESATKEAELLLGEIHSRLGNREQAAGAIQNYLQQGGDAPYARALMAEQRVRTARWEQGINDFVDALHSDPEGHAYAHLKKVLTDLTGAVSKGAMPTQAAEKFVNSLEFNLGDVPPDAQQFFASVRQALDAGRALSGPSGQSPVFEVVGSVDDGTARSSTAPSGPTGPPGSAAGGPPGSSPTNRSGRSSSPASSSGGAATDAGEAPDDDSEGIQAKQKDLAGVIQQDRQANEQLQEVIGQMPPPKWPTERDGSLDPLPRMAWEEQSIFAHAPKLDTSDFRITSGSVRAEIYLERCLQNLLAGARSDRTVSVRFRPEAITQMEINCWDGLLDDLPKMSAIYDAFEEGGHYESLALGRFIGECVARRYDGTWDYAEPPEQSRLVIGDTSLDPLGLAAQWVSADDPEAVDLQSLAEAAERASDASSSLTAEDNYIDPTRELQGQSLEAAIAEIWVQYLFRLEEASFARVSDAIDVTEDRERLLVFTIDKAFAPPLARGANGTALREDGNVSIGYLRETGEFLILSTRKQMVRALRATIDRLDRESAGDAVELLANYHRPGWYWISDDARAREVSQKASQWSPSSPRVETGNQGRILRIEAMAGDQLVEVKLLTHPGEHGEWKIEVASQ